jgi:hypothetical protein
MQYTLLTPDHLDRLRRERVLELEADHARAGFALQESPKDRQALADRAELERRIGIHREELFRSTRTAEAVRNEEPGDPE